MTTAIRMMPQGSTSPQRHLKNKSLTLRINRNQRRSNSDWDYPSRCLSWFWSVTCLWLSLTACLSSSTFPPIRFLSDNVSINIIVLWILVTHSELRPPINISCHLFQPPVGSSLNFLFWGREWLLHHVSSVSSVKVRMRVSSFLFFTVIWFHKSESSHL